MTIHPRHLFHRPRYWLAAVALLSILLRPALAAEEGAGVVWTHEYTGATRPDAAKPGWTHYGDGSSRADKGILTIQSVTGGAEYWMIAGAQGNEFWDGSAPSTIQFSMRVISKSGDGEGAAEIVVTDGARYYPFFLTETNWHIGRITLAHGSAKLYRETDGKPALLAHSQGQPFSDEHDPAMRNYIYFGDGSSSKGGVTEWKFLRWTNKGTSPSQ
jgi:hypothetical protein